MIYWNLSEDPKEHNRDMSKDEEASLTRLSDVELLALHAAGMEELGLGLLLHFARYGHHQPPRRLRQMLDKIAAIISEHEIEGPL